MKVVALCMLFFTLTLPTPARRNEPAVTGNQEQERGQELFFDGAKAIAKGRYEEGRIVLKTLVNAYPDSPFVGQARMLIFYSFAREGGPKNERSAKLLREIEEHLNTDILNTPPSALLAQLQAGSNRSDVEDEDYAVYSALINQKYIKDQIKLIVIQQETENYDSDHDRRPPEETSRHILQLLSPVSQATLADFRIRNAQPATLRDKFDLKVRHTVVPKQEIMSIFQPRGGVPDDLFKAWQQFYKKYPDSPGYIRLSRVGYDSEKGQAMVYVAHGCGGLCGSGGYVLMTKEGNAWSIKNEMPLWVS
ncbi:MAG TPA: hypothetical protein VNO70_26345 [Blastocatellia bacterium]|nr:hypothetical protein [Blastocatellia bacterium]